MPYETDTSTIHWIAEALRHEMPRVRLHAVELLEHVSVRNRSALLSEAERDADFRVAAAAALVGACLSLRLDDAEFELFESDFAEDVEGDDLEWEWEYQVKVCIGSHLPASPRLIWTRDENDGVARQLALMRALPLGDDECDATPIVVGKRLVTRFTRSARNLNEARAWAERGRPRYDGG